MGWREFFLQSKRKLIGIVGMPGSGKSVVDEVARELGFLVIVMGDVVREETSQRGFEPTPENVGRIMLQLRKEEGADVIAKKCIIKATETEVANILIEGIRSLDEVQEFRKRFPQIKILSIHSSPKIRFKRLFNRKRSDDSSNQQNVIERDIRELQVGIGSVIALADHVIVNDGDLGQFRAEVKRFLKVFLHEKADRNC
jgi:dephospho-CoA kinase